MNLSGTENASIAGYGGVTRLASDRFVVAVLALLLGLLTGFTPLQAQTPDEECLKCHGDPSIATQRPEVLAGMVSIPPGQERFLWPDDKVGELYTPKKEFLGSAHGGLKCVDCHTGIERLPHNQRLATVSCSDCHDEVAKKIATGPHREGMENGRKRPDCADCHGSAHRVMRFSKPRTYEQAVAIVRACQKCHDEKGSFGFNPVKTYRENVHGVALFKQGLAIVATCVDCHGHHAMLPPENPDSPISPLKVPETCGRCHQGIKEVFFTSIHGRDLLQGKANAPTCTSCHHSHGIQQIGKPFLLGVVKECSTCHIKLGESYLRSYHGKATQLGDASVAVCSSCHGAHDILPPQDPASRVNKANLVKTCGQCHKNANKNFVKYIAHVNYTDRKQNAAVYFTYIGMTTLLLSVLTVFIIHTLMWFQRTLIDRVKNPKGHIGKTDKERMIRRFHPIHRITHGLIVVSFMGLVATGFPLKYSYTSWAHDFAAVFGGIQVMGTIHRILAVITFTYAGLHLAFLAYFFSRKCPKPRWKYIIGPDSLLFSWRDLKDFVAMVRWFFWLGPRPKFERWTYFEKFDYWGEIWGVIVIGGSGLLMWFPTLFTRWLPGWVLNCAMVVHSIEALLAASVIFLVHFFNTHLRPEKFPIDMVMWTGQMTESEMEEERGTEYKRLVETGTLDKRVVRPVALQWRILGVVLGISAFLFGLFLIVLALKTEMIQFLK